MIEPRTPELAAQSRCTLGETAPTLSALPRERTIGKPSRHVRLVPILLQKSPRREARCALAPNTSLDFELR